MGRGRVALQTLRIADRQHLHRPPGTLRKQGHQITVAGIVAVAGEHRQRVRCRPLAHQRAPRCPGGTLHQFETRRAGGNQPCVEFAHLCGAVQRVG